MRTQTTTLRAAAASTAVTTEYGTSYEDTRCSGTATATTSNKLTASAGAFVVNAVAVGDIVKNTTTGKFALVTAVDSATALSISADIFSNTNTYAIYTNHGVKITPTGVGNFNELIATLNLSALAASDVGDTLDVYLDTSFDDGVTFVNIGHFTQMLGNGAVKRFIMSFKSNPIAASNCVLATSDQSAGAALQIGFGDRFRYRHTLVDADANASFTYSLALQFKRT